MRTLADIISDKVERVNQELARYLPPADRYPERIHAAMRYGVFAGGKRLRPVLTLLSCECCGGAIENALPVACAVEMVHTYSLVHDDLPAMDNDDFRRGKPATHRAFDEATAILAGDALLTCAFQTIADRTPDQSLVAPLVRELARGAGTEGMLGGQMVDILCQGGAVSEVPLEYLHTHKTGALIVASVRCGAIAAYASAEDLACLTRYAEEAGVGFQIVDDLLDLTGSSAELGKTPGKDARQKKLTYPAVFGVERSRTHAFERICRAKEHLGPLGERAEPLRLLADFILERNH